MKRLLEEARKSIRINSVSARGNEELANFLGGLVQDQGLKTQLQQVTHSLEDVSKRQFNVIGVLGDPLVDKKIRKGLLLTSHVDTVGPGLVEHWTDTGGDPFAATIKEGRLHGLGSADAKLDFLCKLHAVSRFRERKLKMPIYLVASCGEELGMFGAKYLIKSLALNPKFVAVGGPTALKIVYSHKSLNIFRVSVGYQQIERDARGFNRRIDLHSFGRGAHAAYPHLGANAISLAFDFLKRAIDSGFDIRFTKLNGGDTVNSVPDHGMVQFYLTSHQLEDFKRFFRETVRQEGSERAFRVELGGVGDMGVRFLPDSLFPCLLEVVGLFKGLATEFQAQRNVSFDPAWSTVNFGLLRQPLGGVELAFDLRLLPDLKPEELEGRLQQKIQAIATRFPSLNLAITRTRMNPALAMTPGHELAKIAREAAEVADIPPEFACLSTSTEAAQYFQAGYESIVFGAGPCLGNSHSPNEHNVLAELEKATVFYEKLIEKICT